jgi:AcrR family transcriptional regulator
MTVIASVPPSPPTDPQPGRRARKRSETLDKLAQTAFRLFESSGYEAVTMEQVAAEADVAKGTLYNHFPVKEALLAHVLHRELADGVAHLKRVVAELPDFRARMTYLLHASADWSEAHRGYLPHYLRFRLANAGDHGTPASARSGLDQAFESLIRAGQQAGDLRPERPAAQLAHLFQFLYLGAMMRWLALPGSDLRQEFDVVLVVFLAGIAAPAARRRQ